MGENPEDDRWFDPDLADWINDALAKAPMGPGARGFNPEDAASWFETGFDSGRAQRLFELAWECWSRTITREEFQQLLRVRWRFQISLN